MALDALGALFWSATYASPGYVFSDQLDRVASHVARMGGVLMFSVAAGFGLYLAHRFANWLRFVRQFKLARITPEQLRAKLEGGEDVLIVDLQGRRDSPNGWRFPARLE